MNNMVQDNFLDFIFQKKIPVTIYLVNGVKLEGYVDVNDDCSILLVRDGHSQLVYKNSISTIMPHEVIELPELEHEIDNRMEPEKNYHKNSQKGWW